MCKLYSGNCHILLSPHKEACFQSKVLPSGLNDKINEVIMIVSNTLGLSGDFKCCMKLVPREIELTKSDSIAVALNNLKAILRIMLKYPHMLKKPATRKITENDYFRCIWLPLFEALFPPESFFFVEEMLWKLGAL
jgi:hypothetical protein